MHKDDVLLLGVLRAGDGVSGILQVSCTDNIRLTYSQILAGPAFVAVFSVSGVLISVLSDKLKASVSRVVLVGAGAAVFSSGMLCCYLYRQE